MAGPPVGSCRLGCQWLAGWQICPGRGGATRAFQELVAGAVTQQACGMASPLLAAVNDGCARGRCHGLLGPGSNVPMWRCLPLYHKPTCCPHVVMPCAARTCRPPRSALVVTLCGASASSSCACARLWAHVVCPRACWQWGCVTTLSLR